MTAARNDPPAATNDPIEAFFLTIGPTRHPPLTSNGTGGRGLILPIVAWSIT